MDHTDAANLGERGLIIHSNDGKYYYMLESQWRPYGIDASALTHSAQLVELGAAAGKTKEGVLINFGSLQISGNPDLTAYDTKGKAGPDSIVIIEPVADKQAFYAIPESAWRGATLEDGADSDAGVLVRRGTVVAAIPDVNVPVGTYCALVNLAVLK